MAAGVSAELVKGKLAAKTGANVYVIGGNAQDYAWGIIDGLSPWRLAPDPAIATGNPEAELWFGAHANGPSPLLDADGEVTGESLSAAVAAEQVPILVKLLAAGKPLSLQIHPGAKLAAEILELQASDPTAPQLLSDPYAKTEMLIALTELSALLGLREPELAAKLVAGIGDEGTQAAAQLRAGQVAAAFRTLIGATAETIRQAEQELTLRMDAAGLDAYAVAAMRSVIENFPGDSGILVAALLNHQQLQPGEAIYVPAGIVHAYVSGIGVEVMAASDNVFRMGLTPKQVAVDQALASLDVDLDPVILQPDLGSLPGGGQGCTYAPGGSPFSVTRVEHGATSAASGEYRLVLAVQGEVKVAVGAEQSTLRQGQAAVVLATEPAAQIETTGVAVIAQSASGSSSQGL